MRLWAQVSLTGLSCFLVGSTHAATSNTPTTSSSPSTSPFRTVNYITHGLPRQCLAPSRKANVTSTTTKSSGSSYSNVPSPIPPSPESHGIVASSIDLLTDLPLASTNVVPSTTEKESSQSRAKTEVPHLPSSTASGDSDDSPLDDDKFMSFEDWKRENLRKAGQSEHIGKGPAVDTQEPRGRPGGLRDSLDSLGDDAEIDLDFSGFVSDGLEPPSQSRPRVDEGIRHAADEVGPSRPPKAGVTRKDAGTTCKERFNYASFDCAANVLKWNPEAKSPSAVLGENKDSYMLNQCSAQNKFLILELCNDISIDTIVLANFEFFSSTFQTFRVSVSDKYPVKSDKWKTLGTFEAHNSREVQAFLIDNPIIWARYLRIEFLTHYGNEFFCPVSLVRVHGTTMLEDYKRDLEVLQTEEDDDDKAFEERSESSAENGLLQEAAAEQLLTQTDSAATSVQTSKVEARTAYEASQPQVAPSTVIQKPSVESLESSMPTSPAQPAYVLLDTALESPVFGTCNASEHDVSTSYRSAERTTTQSLSKDTQNTTINVSVTSSSRPKDATLAEFSATNTTATASNTSAESSRSDLVTDSRSMNASTSASPTNSTKMPASSVQSSAAAPTMQESFFKSVQKRLQMLEANSSLSLQYIEDQSRSLRDAFQKVEQRQLAKTTSFLDYLNTTVLNELREFRQQYDQLWQSTVIELEMQRERYQRDNLAIDARLGILADEIIFQKRVSFLQLILIVVCLGLVLFSKGNMNSYLELPLVQSVLSKSPSTRFVNSTGTDTPVQSHPVSRANSTGAIRKRLGIVKGHRRFPSEDSTENTMSPIEPYTPPTPISFEDPSPGRDILDELSTLGDPEFDPSLIERPSTSPPVLSGAESPATSDLDGEIGDDSTDSVLDTTPTNGFTRKAPVVIIEDATPPPKRLKRQLPEH